MSQNGYGALLRFGSAAPGLVPAHGVQSPIPGFPSFPYFLIISFPNILILPDNPPEWPPRSRHRDLKQRVRWILEAQEASKMPSKFHHFLDAFLDGFCVRFPSQLGAQDGFKIYQKSIKIEFPRPSVSVSFFTSIFHRFWLPTWPPLMSKKCIFPKEKRSFFKIPPFEDNIDFGLDLSLIHI